MTVVRKRYSTLSALDSTIKVISFASDSPSISLGHSAIELGNEHVTRIVPAALFLRFLSLGLFGWNVHGLKYVNWTRDWSNALPLGHHTQHRESTNKSNNARPHTPGRSPIHPFSLFDLDMLVDTECMR